MTAGSDVTTVGFTGHRTHEPSGFVLAQFSVFAPETGRWISADTIGPRDGPNLYGYVANSPLAFVDPLGLQCQEVFRIYLGTGVRTSISPEGPAELIMVNVLRGPTVRHCSVHRYSSSPASGLSA